MYKIHIPYINREDLLRQAIACVAGRFEIHVWCDGVIAPAQTLESIRDRVIYHELPPIGFASVMNMALNSSMEDEIAFFMHADALITPAAIDRTIAAIGLATGPWSVCFSLYDVFCAFNIVALRSVGLFDTMYYQYTSDNDLYLRLRNAGYPQREIGGDGVVHQNTSSSIKSDRLFKHRTEVQGEFRRQYHLAKWGGYPEQERYFYPFNAFHLSIFTDGTPLLVELRADSRTEGNLLDAPGETQTAQLHTLYEWITRWQPRRILEVGTNKGYFGYCLSKILTEFELVTLDSDKRSERACGLLGDHVRFMLGDSRDTLPLINERFDLAWIDGGHDYAPALSDIQNAMRLDIPCIMIDDTNVTSVQTAMREANLAEYYHIVHPYSYHRDDRRMIVAVKKQRKLTWTS